MSIPFLNVKPRAIKLKVSPRFPAQLIGRVGIDVTPQNGNFYVDLNYTKFPTIFAVPPGATNALIFDPATNLYMQLPISLLGGGGGGGVPEAPTDGQLYGRKSSAWSVVPAAGGGIPDAPSDTQLYGRKSATVGGAMGWSVVSSGGVGSAGRNCIINGRFDISQYGASMTVPTFNYAIDMWKLMGESGNVTVFAAAQQFSPTTAMNGAISPNTANIKFGAMQIVEAANCRDLIGGNVTLSARLGVTNAATITNVKMAVLAWTGTADTAFTNPVSAWNAAGTNPTLAANWSYLGTPVNLNVPAVPSSVLASVSGAISGTVKNLAVIIWCDSKTTGVGDQIAVGDVQLEGGLVATAYLVRPRTTELILCQRYLEKSYDVAVVAGTANNSNSGAYFTSTALTINGRVGGAVSFKVSKHHAPTIGMYSPVTGANSKMRDAFNAVDVTPTIASIGENGFQWFATPSTGAFCDLSGHWVADARL